MPSHKLFAGRGRTAVVGYAMMLLGICWVAAPLKAQTSSDSLPPWQRPPKQGARQPSPSVERTAYTSAKRAASTNVKRTAYNPAPERIGTPAPEPVFQNVESPAMTSPASSSKRVSILDDDYMSSREPNSGPAPRGDPTPRGGQPVAGPLLNEGSIVDDGNLPGEGGDWCNDECSECDGGEFPSCLNPFADRLWIRSEFLSMWGKSPTMQPLATTSDPGTSRPQAGVLGLRTTHNLFGGENEDLGYLPGGRFTLGYKLRPCEESGLEVTYMFLGDTSAHFTTNNSSTPIIVRPFFNTQTNAQDSLVIALPNQQTGNIAIGINDEFSSIDVLWRQATMLCNGREVGFLAGYRYAHFAEKLNIDSTSTFVSQVGVIPVGTVSQVSDQFAAKNEFQGGELGVSSKRQYCRWSVELLGKVALGNTRSTVDISGNSVIISPNGQQTTSNGGLLALPTNIGRTEHNNFTVIPELGVNIGYDITCRLKATVGYSFLYWSRVARPTDQLDLSVNPTQLSSGTLLGTPAPLFRYTPGDFWVQGITFGLDYRF